MCSSAQLVGGEHTKLNYAVLWQANRIPEVMLASDWALTSPLFLVKIFGMNKVPEKASTTDFNEFCFRGI
jgi:hypothetical protein